MTNLPDDRDTLLAAAVSPDGRRITEALSQIGAQADAELDLSEAALLLAAADRPKADLEPYRTHLQQLAADLTQHGAQAETGEAKARALAAVIADLHGYEGDRENFDDPDNANLMAVIDRRRGLPVALGLLYLHAARSQGWAMHGLNFPGHFLLALEGRERLILDPFDRGRRLDAPALRSLRQKIAGPGAELLPVHTAPVSDRSILIRLLNNQKSRALEANDFRRGLTLLSRLLLIAPDTPEFLYEFGVVSARTGNLTAGLNALQQCVAGNPPARIKGLAAAALQQFKPKLN